MSDHDPNGVCSHVDEIADALARHDFPGLPSISELHESTQAAYRNIAETALLKPVPAIGDTPSTITSADWFNRDDNI